MIYKSISRHSASYGALLSYITKEGKSKEGKPILFTQNLKEKEDIKKIIREFQENESFRRFPRANQVYIFHELLSLSKHENPELITDEMLHDLAQKFLELRGSDTMAVYAIHDDKEHKHIHFAISGVKYRTGLANRVSQEAFKDIKIQLQSYQELKYPQLSFSSPEHGKGTEYLKDAEWHLKKRNERTLTKETIREKVTLAYSQSKTQKEFLERLRDEHGLLHYERNGKMQGLMDVEGTKFRFSRLDVDMETLPINVIEKTEEEERVMEEIQAIRLAREEQEIIREIESDNLDFSRFIHINPNSLFE